MPAISVRSLGGRLSLAGCDVGPPADGRSLLTPRRRRVKVTPKRKIRELPESLAFEAVGK